MSLTLTLQKILSQIESLNIPEGDYLTISNDLKIVHDGIKKLEEAKNEPNHYIEQYNYSWEHETPQIHVLPLVSEYSWGTGWDTNNVSEYRNRAGAFEDNEPYTNDDEELPDLVEDQELIDDERIAEWQRNYMNEEIIS